MRVYFLTSLESTHSVHFILRQNIMKYHILASVAQSHGQCHSCAYTASDLSSFMFNTLYTYICVFLDQQQYC